jgi:hypothetical protein
MVKKFGEISKKVLTNPPPCDIIKKNKGDKTMVDFNTKNMETFYANNGQYPSATRYK